MALYPVSTLAPSGLIFPGMTLGGGGTAGPPDSGLVEIEFTAGTWTDVSQWVEWSAGVRIRFGRTSPREKPQTASLNLTLNNTDGRFTPLSATLVDGTPNPYYPNVVPRKRIRASVVVDSSTFTRFTGFIKSWPPQLDGGYQPRVPITATTREDQLAKVAMMSPIAQEVTTDGPAFYWPLTDAAGTTAAMETASGRRGATLGVVGFPAGGGTLTFGDNGPGVGDGTGVKLVAGTSKGKALQQLNLPRIPAGGGSGFTFELWAQATAAGAGTIASLMFDLSGDLVLTVRPSVTGSMTYTDIGNGSWRHIAVTVSTGSTMRVYIDGVLSGSQTWGTSFVTGVLLGADLNYQTAVVPTAPGNFTGWLGQVAMYRRELSAAEVASHAAATNGYWGETVNSRIARWLGYAGLTAADWSLDSSTVAVGTYPQTGRSVLEAVQDITDTEGGGSVVYATPNGLMRFTSRSFRDPGPPSVTVDSGADLDRDAFAPEFDDETIVNQSQGQRGTATGTAATLVANDAASQSVYQLSAEQFTSYATSDDDVRANAQQRVATQRTPAFRLGQIKVDLWTGQTPDLAAAVAGTEIGQRIRVTSLYKAAAPASQVDVLVEGWSEVFSDTEWSVTFDTSPADAPASGLYNDAAYGKYATDGQTLNASVTSSATTVVIATAAGKPTFTTSAGAYPLTIAVDTERITLGSAPSGGTSPQTFTGVTRGAGGTSAAAHSSAAVVRLAPEPTFAL